MEFEEFERLAHEMFADVPDEFRQGVDGLSVRPDAPPHPDLPDIYTLGECVAEALPGDFAGPSDLHSFVVLYHGSFQRIAARSPDFDWETEMWNTITHEIRHHIEFRAEEDALEVQDYAEEQNFARREGRPFDTLFFRTGVPRGAGAFEVDGDLFVEREMDRDAFDRAAEIEIRWEGGSAGFVRPDEQGEVHFVTLAEHDWPRGDLIAVLIRRRGVLASLKSALAGGGRVLHGIAGPSVAR